MNLCKEAISEWLSDIKQRILALCTEGDDEFALEVMNAITQYIITCEEEKASGGGEVGIFVGGLGSRHIVKKLLGRPLDFFSFWEPN